MTRRKRLSSRVRFEVFRRDKFTCQYCGMKAPDVTLHVDHVKPVAAGGSNRIDNLLSACAGCNFGKSTTDLSGTFSVQTPRESTNDGQIAAIGIAAARYYGQDLKEALYRLRIAGLCQLLLGRRPATLARVGSIGLISAQAEIREWASGLARPVHSGCRPGQRRRDRRTDQEPAQ